MTEIPAAAPPVHIMPTWAGIGIVGLLAVGLALLALVAVATTLRSAGHPLILVERIKSLVATLVWIVPALVLVVYMARETVHVSPIPGPILPVIRTHDEMRGVAPIQEIQERSRLASYKTETIPDGSGLRAEATSPSPPHSPTPPLPPVPAIPNASLHVRETLNRAPEWEGKDAVPSANGVLVPLSSQRFATLGEAEQDVTQLAAAYVKEFYRNEYPIPGDWSVPISVIEKNAVNSLVGEEFEKDFGDGHPQKMYRAHLRLDLNPALRQGLHASWHDQIVAHRLVALGSLVGLATLMLATSAGYFRLDSLTGGQYRRRLKLAAAALIAAGGLVVARV